MTSDITCQRCGGIAIRSPLCGSCAYALGVPAWERIKMRADQIVSDAALDRWMDTHPANPANQDATARTGYRKGPDGFAIKDEMADPTNTDQQHHEDQYAFEAFQQWRSDDK